MPKLLSFLILLTITGCSNVQPLESSAKQATSSETPKTTFPFTLVSSLNNYAVSINLESDDVAKQYGLFIKYKYTGNGYSYEGLIMQIVEELDKDLLNHITFDSEAGAFYARIDTEENQFKFVNLLSPIFSDLTKLEEWLKKADRSKIND
jgi:hypothetical protein